MSEIFRGPKRITRRVVLATIRDGIIIGSILGVGEIIRESADRRHTVKSSGTQKRSQFLQATATAVVEQGRDNSFQERYGFTKEIFEQVRKSTFIIETGYGIATGWLAKKTGEYLYIATSRHLIYTVYAGIKIGKVAIWRPNIDKDRQGFPWEAAGFYGIDNPQYNLDMAVIKVKADEAYAQGLQALNWQDDVLLDKGQRFLIVGFPVTFFGTDYRKALALGSVVTSKGVVEEKSWLAEGVVGHGNSGSPAVVLRENGTPLVVGMVSGIRGTNEFSVTKLKLSPIIQQMDSSPADYPSFITQQESKHL